MARVWTRLLNISHVQRPGSQNAILCVSGVRSFHRTQNLLADPSETEGVDEERKREEERMRKEKAFKELEKKIDATNQCSFVSILRSTAT